MKVENEKEAFIFEAPLYVAFTLTFAGRIYFEISPKNSQLPIFAYTIFGVKELNCCVRDGNRCILFAIVTNLL